MMKYPVNDYRKRSNRKHVVPYGYIMLSHYIGQSPYTIGKRRICRYLYFGRERQPTHTEFWTISFVYIVRHQNYVIGSAWPLTSRAHSTSPLFVLGVVQIAPLTDINKFSIPEGLATGARYRHPFTKYATVSMKRTFRRRDLPLTCLNFDKSFYIGWTYRLEAERLIFPSSIFWWHRWCVSIRSVYLRVLEKHMCFR